MVSQKLEEEFGEFKKNKQKNLEFEIVKEDLKKVGKIAAKVVTYPTLGNFAIPTMIRKAYAYGGNPNNPSYDDINFAMLSFVGFALENIAGYAAMAKLAPELISPLALVQIGTNIGSGVYEYIRMVKKRAK